LAASPSPSSGRAPPCALSKALLFYAPELEPTLLARRTPVQHEHAQHMSIFTGPCRV
jgi:hypothetical protein